MAQRRALVIGIDDYDNFSRLNCAVNDARAVAALLERNDDDSLNYTVRLVVSGAGFPAVTRVRMRELWIELFDEFDGDALFYFSGHGAQTRWGGHLVTQDATAEELGVSMEDLLVLANTSNARDVVLVLDCCHSGDLGNPPILQGLERPLSMLREGMTVMAASRPNQLAYEANGHSHFTEAILEGLKGGAADHMGSVNAASLFVFVDRLFDAWAQRPMYKSHTSVVSTLRVCRPPVDPAILRTITTYFPGIDDRIRLDPEYEADDAGAATPERAKKRDDSNRFKRLRDGRLLETVDGDDLYWAAMNSKEIQLTILGRYFWRLLKRGTI